VGVGRLVSQTFLGEAVRALRGFSSGTRYRNVTHRTVPRWQAIERATDDAGLTGHYELIHLMGPET